MEKEQVVLEMDSVKKNILKKFRDLKRSKAGTTRLISDVLQPVINPLKEIKKEISGNQSILSPMSSSTPLVTPKKGLGKSDLSLLKNLSTAKI